MDIKYMLACILMSMIPAKHDVGVKSPQPEGRHFAMKLSPFLCFQKYADYFRQTSLHDAPKICAWKTNEYTKISLAFQ